MLFAHPCTELQLTRCSVASTLLWYVSRSHILYSLNQHVFRQELDSPGHTTGIASAHPEHIACPNKSPWSKYANEPPAGQLRIASEGTIDFSKQLFDAIARNLKGTMMSSGGDEVNLPCWEEDQVTVQDLARRNMSIAQALDAFVVDIQGVIKQHNKVPFIKSGMCHRLVFYSYRPRRRYDFDP